MDRIASDLKTVLDAMEERLEQYEEEGLSQNNRKTQEAVERLRHFLRTIEVY